MRYSANSSSEGSKKGLVIGGIVLVLVVIFCCCCLLSSVSSLIAAMGESEPDVDVSVGTGGSGTGTGTGGTGTGTGGTGTGTGGTGTGTGGTGTGTGGSGTGGGFDGSSTTGCGNLKATFYGGPNFSGDKMSLGLGDWDKNDFHEGVYDDVESIKIDSGLKVTAYQDDNQDDSRGKWIFTQDVPQTPNKRIESIRIECAN